MNVDGDDDGDGDECFDNLGADFWDQLVRVEQDALKSTPTATTSFSSHSHSHSHSHSYSHSSSTNPSQAPTFQPPFSTTFLDPPLPPPSLQLPTQQVASFSPPHELSQRTTDCFSARAHPPSRPCHFVSSLSRDDQSAKNLRTDLSKRELGRVSKRPTQPERLRKEESKRDDQLDPPAVSNAEQQYGSVNILKSASLAHGIETEHKRAKTFDDRIGNVVHVGKAFEFEPPSYNAIGVQTDNVGDTTDDGPSFQSLSEELQSIWGIKSVHKVESSLVSKLFRVCSEDFKVLFACMSVKISSKRPLGSVAVGRSSWVSSSSSNMLEAAKLSQLYSVLTQINNGILLSEALFEPLLALCNLENVVIVRSSLHMLHVLLEHLLSLRQNLDGRDNVKIDGFHSGETVKCKGLPAPSWDELSNFGFGASVSTSFDPQTLGKKGCWNFDGALPISCEGWVSLFELMNQVATKYSEEHVTVKAVSVIKLILMRSDAFTERDKFGQTSVFRTIAELLKKKTSSWVRKEAVQVLHLLLNCPKLLCVFCAGCKEGESADASNDEKSSSLLQVFSLILLGLADSVICTGNTIHDVELRKGAIVTLAFLVSSGKSGFEILIMHKLAGEANFLFLILQALASEMDIDSESTEPTEIVRARTLLIREALILLNRLVCNPAYSATVLRLLASSRYMAGLAIDIASRLYRTDKKCVLSENSLQQVRELEIVDLTQVFKKRISAYFGDRIS